VSFTVELTDTEMSICRMVGNMRTMVSRATSTRDQKIGPQSGINVDEDGAIAEYAFCKKFNIHFDLNIHTRAGSYDCVLKKKRIDVKSTRVRTGHLAVKLARNPDVDIFVLAIIDGNEVSFPGWANSEDVYQEHTIKDLGHGKGHCLTQDQLRKWK
jgi:hypothetical protein